MAAWAMGAGGRLSPFRSVAIDTKVIPMGKVLYIPELDGMLMLQADVTANTGEPASRSNR